MAEDIKRVLDIEFNGQQTISDLKREVAGLKKELDGCAAGSAEAKAKAQELAQAQNNLKAAMKGCVDENGKLNNSYNGMSVQMAKLKAAQKDVDLSTRKGRKEYKAYAKEINKLNDKLKDADAANGVWSRNVGNYANSIKDAFGSMGGAVGGVITSITSGLKMLCTNPWVAVLTLIVAALKQLVDAFKRNSDAMKSMQIVGNNFKAVFVAIQRAFDALVPKVVELTQKIGELFNRIKNGKIAEFISKGMNYIAGLIKDFANSWMGQKLGLDKVYESLSSGFSSFTEQFGKDAKEAKEILDKITNAEEAALKRRTANLTANANDRKKIAELNEIVSDRENKTVEERVQAAKDAAELQRKIVAREKAEIQDQINILKLKQSLNQSNNEDALELAQLNAQLIDKTSEYNQVNTQLNNTLKTLGREGLKEANQAEKERKEAIDASIKAVETEKSALNSRLALVKKYSADYYQIKEDILAKDEELAKLKAAKEIADETELQETLLQIDEEYRLKRESAALDRKKDDRAVADKRRENGLSKSELENGAGSIQYYQDQLDAARDYYNSLEQLQDESNEDYEARQLKALKDLKDKESQLNEKRLSNYTGLANGIADLMSNVADAWSDNIQRQVDAGKISEEEGEKQFENVKAMQIAVATIQMITGIVTALSGTWTTKTGIWDIAIAATQAASIAASGIANIAKIKNTTLGSSSTASAGSASFALPNLESYAPNYTQNLTGAADAANLQGAVRSAIEGADIKAYVVESEITGAQKRSSKRNAEATW